MCNAENEIKRLKAKLYDLHLVNHEWALSSLKQQKRIRELQAELTEIKNHRYGRGYDLRDFYNLE